MSDLARRSTGAVARLLVLLLTLGTSLPFAIHVDEGHDPCDAPASAGVGATSLHLPGAPVKPQHCEVCHWLRSLRAFDTALATPAGTIEGGRFAFQATVSPLARLHVRPAPSRAPPA
jgi:hypothetical protein